jgi:hypothetical protein
LLHKLHNGLYIHEDFLDASCECRKKGMFAYEQALHATKVWPLMVKTHGKNQYSVAKVIDLLDNFKYIPPVKDCSVCSSDFRTTVDGTALNFNSSFGGLCLDCIKKPVRKDKLQIR